VEVDSIVGDIRTSPEGLLPIGGPRAKLVPSRDHVNGTAHKR
jgi:hypothetical protein